MSVVQYGTYVAEEGFNGYCPKAKARFKKYFHMVNTGEMSMNSAYKYAQANGDTPEDTGFKGGFKEWIQRAQVEGWVDKGLDVLDAMLGVKKPETEEETYAPQKPRITTGGWVAIGLGVVGLATVIYLATRKK